MTIILLIILLIALIVVYISLKGEFQLLQYHIFWLKEAIEELQTEYNCKNNSCKENKVNSF